MIAMSLMSVVIIAFAAVFPSGYRLNFATHNQAKATGFANAVAEQLANKSQLALAGYESTATPPANKAAALLADGVVTLPSGLIAPVASNYKEPNVFWLDSVTVVPQTIQNPFTASGGTDPNSAVTNDCIAQIYSSTVTVTVKWIEYRRSSRTSITKSATVTTLTNSTMSR